MELTEAAGNLNAFLSIQAQDFIEESRYSIM